jgi:hypothetical protein
VRVNVKNIGLAAYIKLHGVEIISATAHTVTFESDRTGQEWRTAYLNSEYARYNGLLIDIQNLKKGTE